MLYLASRSPRRRELLATLGLVPALIDLDVPEQRGRTETPEDYVRRVARDKARAGLAATGNSTHAVVLAADTEVVLEDRVYGKPTDAADAAEMLRSLSGREHRVLSAVCACAPGHEAEILHVSSVRFAAVSETHLARYLASEEWRGKAGAYGIQGLAAAFVVELRGSHSGVMGLPLHETAALLAGFGLGPLAESPPGVASGRPRRL